MDRHRRGSTSAVELSAHLRGEPPFAGFYAFTGATIAFLLAAAHDAVLYGLAWRNLVLVPTVPFALFWAWRQRRILKGPSVWRVPEGIELRDLGGTRLIRLADAIALRRWGPRAFQLAYFDWWQGQATRHRLFFACRADLPEDALAFHDPLAEQPLSMTSTPQPDDAADPHGTRALLLSLLPRGTKHLDDGNGGGGLGMLALVAVVCASQMAFRLTASWVWIALCVLVPVLLLVSRQEEMLRSGDPVVEPTETALILHRPWRRAIPWAEVRTVEIVDAMAVITIGAGWKRSRVARALAPSVLEAAIARREEASAPS